MASQKVPTTSRRILYRALGLWTHRSLAQRLQVRATSVLWLIKEGGLAPVRCLLSETGEMEWLFLPSQLEDARILVSIVKSRYRSIEKLGLDAVGLSGIERAEIVQQSHRVGIAAIDDEQAWALHKKLSAIALRRTNLPARVVSLASHFCWGPSTWQGMKATI